MDVTQARDFVRVWIESGMRNPSEGEFKKTLGMLKNEVLDQLAAYCDQLINNFRVVFGPSAEGIPVAQRAKAIILASKS